MNAWQPIATATEGVEVETAIIDAEGQRNTQTLIRKGRLWFFPDFSMYVYYTPTHWRHLAVSTAVDAAVDMVMKAAMDNLDMDLPPGLLADIRTALEDHLAETTTTEKS